MTTEDKIYNQHEDKIMKSIMDTFSQYALSYFGIDGKVKEVTETEQIMLDLKDYRMDYVFLMEDDTYVHFEFQTTDKGVNDLARFLLYDAMLFEKHRKPINTYVIYSGDIINPKTILNYGANTYSVKSICMYHRNADEILNDIENKLIENKHLTPQEQLDLVFTPIMSGSSTKYDRLVKATKLTLEYDSEYSKDAQTLLYVFAQKFLKNEELEKYKEVIKMTKLGRMLVEDGKQEGKLELIKIMLSNGADINYVSKVTGISLDIIKDILVDINSQNSQVKQF